jgi:hypothetical protein
MDNRLEVLTHAGGDCGSGEKGTLHNELGLGTGAMPSN